MEPMSDRSATDAGRPADAVLLTAVSNTARESARVSEREGRVRQRTERLNRISNALVAAVSAQAIAEVVSGEASEAVGARAATFGLLTDDNTMFEIELHSGVAEDVVAQWHRFPNLGSLPFPHVVRTQQPLFVGTCAEYARRFPSIAEQYARHGFQASAILPLSTNGRVLGALSLEFGEPREFPDDECAFLTTIANQTALALDRARLYEQEQAARTEAEQANRAKSNFLAVMSHELRTPLNTISGYIDLMLAGVHGPLPEPYAGYADRIRAAQKYLTGLIDSVLRFAKIEAGQITYDIGTHGVADLLRSLEPLVEPQVTARNIAFVLEPGDPAQQVRADSEKVIQILLNLVANALKYTEPGGTVTVTTLCAGPTVGIRVSDTGRGIPQDQIESIFEPFVQVGALTRETEGVGLGLAISRELARGMDGELNVTSTMGQGSCFTLRLPAA